MSGNIDNFRLVTVTNCSLVLFCFSWHVWRFYFVGTAEGWGYGSRPVVKAVVRLSPRRSSSRSFSPRLNSTHTVGQLPSVFLLSPFNAWSLECTHVHTHTHTLLLYEPLRTVCGRWEHGRLVRLNGNFTDREDPVFELWWLWRNVSVHNSTSVCMQTHTHTHTVMIFNH